MKKDFFLICFLYASLLFSQSPAYIQLTEKEGLPDIDFYGLTEDEKGLIWLASDSGLYCYNGKDYKLFANKEQKGNAVFGIKKDTKNRIWCNNLSGQFFFTKGENLELFLDLSKILIGELTSFIVTGDSLVIFTGRNILEVDLDTKKVHQKYREERKIGAPYIGVSNFTYIDQNYIKKTNKNFKVVDSLNVDVFDDYTNNSGISKYTNVFETSNYSFFHFLRFNKNIFYQYDITKKNFKKIETPLALKTKVINHVFKRDKEIWFATNTGVYIYHFDNDSFKFIHNCFKNINVTKIIKDLEDNFWLTTIGKGIFVIPNINVKKYKLPENLKSISQLKKSNDSLLFLGTKNGNLAKLNISNGVVKTLDKSSKLTVREILKDNTGEDFIAIRDVGAVKIIRDNSKIQKLNVSEITSGLKKLSSINDTRYLLSSYKSAVILNNDFEKTKQLTRKRSYTNFYDSKNKLIYVSSLEGLFLFDADFNKKEILFKGNSIFAKSITKSKNGIIWVSTFKNGVFGINKDVVTAHYLEENGLISNKVEVIKGDENNLWITTRKGIQLLNTIDSTFKNITKKEGIPSYRISDIEFMGSKVFFGSHDGVFGFDKKKVFKEKYTPKIHFTEIIVGGKKKILAEEYNLNYDERSIKIKFNVNGFQSSLNNLYEYRLIGEHNTWTKLDKLINVINYNSLPSGTYTFQIRSVVNNTAIDNTESIQFVIAKPFWNKWWFYVLVIAFLFGTLSVLYDYKIKKLKEKQGEELEKELVKKKLIVSQLENLRSQMNPHFIFNALNSIQEYIVFNEKELASSFLIKFSRLIRIYLEHSRTSEVVLEEELNALGLYLELEKNRFEDLLNYTIKVSEEIKKDEIKIPSLFIQPYVENAIKHGLLHKTDDRKLLIDFKLNKLKNTLICIVEDNGIGIEASQEINRFRRDHKSFATSANKKRIDLLNFKREHKLSVTVESLKTKDTNGTRIIIKIPT